MKSEIFWNMKEQYFEEARRGDLTPQRKANLALLESLLDKAYRAGRDCGFREGRRARS